MNLIKNLKLPICVNCKNFIHPRSTITDIEYGKCNKFGTKNIITGDIEYKYASTCRNYEQYCGINGKFYKEMPDPRDAIKYYNLANPKQPHTK